MKRILLILLACLAPAFAGDYWHAETGASAMQFLYLNVSPRTAALSGAGVATPAGPSELSRNPLASLAATEAEIGWNQIVFSDRIGAQFLSLYYAMPYENFVFSGALEFLGYDDLEGRDDEGFETGEFAASAWAAQLGVGFRHAMFRWALSARFASQTIDDETAFGFLADGGVSVALNRNFSFATKVTNAGYVTEYEGNHRVPPTAVQSGITATYPLTEIFDLAMSLDMYRQADSDLMAMAGAELSFRKMLVFRAGYAYRPDTENGVSGGLGLRFGNINVEYAYATNPVLDGDHHINVALRF